MILLQKATILRYLSRGWLDECGTEGQVLRRVHGALYPRDCTEPVGGGCCSPSLFFKLSRGRMQDLNFPGKWVGVLAFPLFGVLALPLLCFLSGHRWSNSFGDPPEPSGLLKVAATFDSLFASMAHVPLVSLLYRLH